MKKLIITILTTAVLIGYIQAQQYGPYKSLTGNSCINKLQVKSRLKTRDASDWKYEIDYIFKNNFDKTIHFSFLFTSGQEERIGRITLKSGEEDWHYNWALTNSTEFKIKVHRIRFGEDDSGEYWVCNEVNGFFYRPERTDPTSSPNDLGNNTSSPFSINGNAPQNSDIVPDRQLSEEEIRQRKYKEAIHAARTLDEGRYYKDAIPYYEKAVKYNPDDFRAKQRIRELRELLNKQESYGNSGSNNNSPAYQPSSSESSQGSWNPNSSTLYNNTPTLPSQEERVQSYVDALTPVFSQLQSQIEQQKEEKRRREEAAQQRREERRRQEEAARERAEQARKEAIRNSLDYQELTSLKNAIENKKYYNAKNLIENYIDPTFKDDQGNTALYYVIELDWIYGIEHLMKKGADINAQNDEGKTVMHYAIQYKDLKYAKKLAEYSPDYNLRDNYGNTLLHTALKIKSNNEEKTDEYIVEAILFLMSQGMDINMADKNEATVLHKAIEKDNLRLVQLAINLGADVNLEKRYNSPLELTINANKTNGEKIAVLLIKNGAELEPAYGLSPYKFAKKRNKYRFENLLSKKSIDKIKAGFEVEKYVVKIIERNEITPETWKNEIIPLFEKKGVPINNKIFGSSILLWAAKSGAGLDILNSLITNGADYNTRDKKLGNILHVAAGNNDIELLKYFVETKKMNVNLKDISLHEEYLPAKTPLDIAISYEKIEAIRYLVEKGATLRDEHLEEAADMGDVELIKYLIKKGNLQLSNADECETLSNAVRSKKIELVKYLESEGLNIKARSKLDRQTLMFPAVRSGNKEMVSYLFGRGLSIHGTDKDARSLINEAAASGDMEMLELLLDKGLTIPQSKAFKATLLEDAARSGNLEMLEYFTEKGFDIKNDKAHLVYYATVSREIKMVEYFIEKGIDVNKTPHEWSNPLRFAVVTNNKEIVNALLNAGAKKTLYENFEDFMKATQGRGRTEMADLLRKHI